MAQGIWRPEDRSGAPDEGSGERECTASSCDIGFDTRQADSAGSCPGKLLSPAHRRRCIDHIRTMMPVSEQRLYRVLGQHRSTQRKAPRGADDIDPWQAESAACAAAQLATTSLVSRLAGLGLLRIDLYEDRVDMVIGERELLRICGLSIPDDHDVVIAITAPVTRVRPGSELKLFVPGPYTLSPRTPDPQLVDLVTDAFAVRKTMLATGKPVSVIAVEGGKCRNRMMRMLPSRTRSCSARCFPSSGRTSAARGAGVRLTLNLQHGVVDQRLWALFSLQRRRISAPSRVPQMGSATSLTEDTGDYCPRKRSHSRLRAEWSHAQSPQNGAHLRLSQRAST
jgi:hypothetical protein